MAGWPPLQRRRYRSPSAGIAVADHNRGQAEWPDQAAASVWPAVHDDGAWRYATEDA